ncbi:MAG: heme exporter protein CcmD [Salinisphaeraceae bacterium]|nr:heme exporter protein CcmD [Salinisphaeraceae bacterium]
MDWQSFWAMGGHGFYVWSSFAIVAVVMIANVLQPLWALRQQKTAIRRQSEQSS